MSLFSLSAKKRHSIIWKDHVIRFLASKSPSHDQITTAKEVFLPPGFIQDGLIKKEEELIEFLIPIFEEWGLKNVNIQMTIPDSQLIIRQHQVKKGKNREEILGQLYFDLGDSFLLPWSDPLFDFQIIKKGEVLDDILVFAVQEKVVEQYKSLVEKLSLSLNAIDVRPLCCYRLFSERLSLEKNKEQVLVMADQQTLTFAVFENSFPLFYRYLPLNPIDSQYLTENDSKNSWKEQIFQELERVLHFYRYNVKVGKGQFSHLLLCGDHSNSKEIQTFIAEQTDIPVMTYSHSIEDQTMHHFYDLFGLILKKKVRS
ncbi:type IV pilus biogenesis protein PilM [Alkalihalobacillus trypoxylicola]|uniref:Pilus assembly protein PilM n=1 Tax=Alkalihalobacillus trypoxylicola TaxID=519424 RepID=A0A162ED03_9BACI|nr:pilus assembly protein PilM [Alkalihalobacillus trypoxylicola]KYG32305.1 hypothetical protein AZF04_05945 [Alkalihalobacillus trypoxylicola]